MKKAICRTYYLNKLNAEQQEFIGYDPGYLWRSTDFFNGPRKAGRYLVIKKNGMIEEMCCTGTHTTEDKARELFHMAMKYAGRPYSEVYLNGKEITDSDLINLYRSPWSIWYVVDNWYEYEDCHTDIYICDKGYSGYPLYFLDLNLDDKIEMDEKGEIAGTDVIQYFKQNLNGEFEKEEE